MESPSLEKENIIKDVRDLFRLEKLKQKKIDATIKDRKNIFKLEKENEKIKDRILRDIRNVFRLEKENKAIKYIIFRNIRNLFENKEIYYKPVRVSNFWSNNYIEYERNGDRNKTLSVEEYLNKIRPYLKEIINNLKKFDMWKIQLTIANNFIFTHAKSDNIEIMINNEADEVIE